MNFQYSAFAESVGFAPQRIHDTQLEANIKSSAYSWRNLSLRSHWNIFSFADVDTLKFKVIFPRRKVEACDMSLAGRDDYVFCCKHEQCGTRLKVWQSNEFGVKGVTCLYSVSPQNSSVASGQKKWESVILWLFSSGCEISACRLFDNVPATFWNLHVPSCTCSVELTSNSDVTSNKLLKKWPIVMMNTLCRQKSKYSTMPGVSFWSTN